MFRLTLGEGMGEVAGWRVRLEGGRFRGLGTSPSSGGATKEPTPGKHHDGGGAGLLLRVDATGARLWIQRLMVRGNRRELRLGGFPTVTPAEAREVALENNRVAF